MGKTRDRRTKKDDVLIPVNILPALRAMPPEEAKQFMIGIMEMGEAACEAGFKKSADELQTAVANVVDEQANGMKAGANPLLAFLIDTITAKIEAQTVRYYERSNTQSLNRTATTAPNITSATDIANEVNRLYDWLERHYAAPTEKQMIIVKCYAAHGGTLEHLSMQLIQADKMQFDPYDFMIKCSKGSN